MRRAVALLVLLATLPMAGCAEMRPLLGNPITPAPRTGHPEALRDAVNRLTARRTATVELADGRAIRADALRIERDSAHWHDPDAGRSRAVATGDVRRVLVPRHRLQAGEGIMGGFIGGAVTGALMGYLLPDDGFVTPGSESALSALLFGTLGAVVGGLASGGSGGEATFVFEPTGP